MKDACYMLTETWDSFERQSMENAWNKLWPDLEGEKEFNDNHREEITEFVQSTLGFQECDEEKTVTSVQEESDSVVDETDEDEDNNNNGSIKSPSNADAFSALETAVEWYELNQSTLPYSTTVVQENHTLPVKNK
ncbi:hypothetical protein TNCV_2924631 [Trichonephila clavipes]|nr:hypothetical protein TNCV_2924631 [Trichonephila clavipes]